MSKFPSPSEQENCKLALESDKFERLIKELFKVNYNFLKIKEANVIDQVSLRAVLEDMYMLGCHDIKNLFRDETLSFDREKRLKVDMDF